MSKVIHLNEKNFDETVSTSKPVLVDFWAPWCGPCKMLGPTIDALAEEVDDSVGVAKVNVDESPDLAQRFGINAIPTLLIFKNGHPVGTAGTRSKDDLKKQLLLYV